MKHLRFLSLLLALMLTLGCVVACNEASDADTPDTMIPEEQENDAPVYTLGNIRNEIADYTVVRPDGKDDLTDCAVLIRTAAEEKTGYAPGITTDYIVNEDDFDPAAPEILVGKTNREESTQAYALLAEKAPYLITQIGNKICIVGKDSNAIVAGVNEFLAIYFNYTVEGEEKVEHHNVRDYGAAGDGTTDDSLAFKKAAKAAEADGLPVYVPTGKYLITETITLNSVTLYGYSSGAWTADNSDLPVVYHDNLEEPLFDVVSGSISGLHINVRGAREAKENGTEAVETVRLQQVGARASNLKINNPYIGISTYYNPRGTGNPGRCFIENIFIIQAWNTGVYVHGTYDVATLCNIEVWNNDMANSCPTAFRFGKNDDIRCVNLFAFNASTGFMFEESVAKADGTKEGCWGSFTNCSVDYTSIGVQVSSGTHHLTFIGGTYWGHHHGLKINSSTSKDTLVTFSGCEIKTNGASPIDIAGGWMTTVSGCNLIRVMDGHTAPPVNITGGTAVTITGNTIATADTAINITSNFKGAANVTGNTLLSEATTESTVIRNYATKAKVNTEGNVILINQSFE